MPNTQYTTLVDYMERTGTTAERLLEEANKRLRGGQKMSRTLFSYILRGSRRCSGEKAWAICQITGVPMEELTRWPKTPRSTKLRKPRSSNGDSGAEY